MALKDEDLRMLCGPYHPMLNHFAISYHSVFGIPIFWGFRWLSTLQTGGAGLARRRRAHTTPCSLL